MSLDLVTSNATLPAEFIAELDRAKDFALAEKATSTRRAYRSDFDIFTGWCQSRGAAALPASPETVAAFFAFEAGRGTKASTIGRRCAAIRYVHRLAGLDTPTDAEGVRATLRGIRRSLGVAPKKKAPATADRLIPMVAPRGGGIAELRDRALLLLGFAIAARRSELVALDVADTVEDSRGLLVTIRRAKTDQEGRGATVAVVRGSIACPVAAFNAWTSAAGIFSGPIFRSVSRTGTVSPNRLSDRSVANIVKFYATRLGLKGADFSGHSLRAGFITSAAAKGASLFKLMDVSRHRSVDTLKGYVRDTELFRDHAGTGLL